MSIGASIYPQYFNQPFSVRDANGRPFERETGPASNCSQPRPVTDVSIDSGSVHEQQREQRRSCDYTLGSHEANFQHLNKDILTMETSSPRSMLKRKHSESIFLQPEPKRIRTFSEPHFLSWNYPQNQQLLQQTHGDKAETSDRRLCPYELNPLVFGMHQSPEAFNYDINRCSNVPYTGPVQEVGNNASEDGYVYQMSVHNDDHSLRPARYPFESPPVASDFEHSESSSQVCRSIETLNSSQISSDERPHGSTPSRGPSFSPITTCASTPDPEACNTESQRLNLRSHGDLQDPVRLQTSDPNFAHMKPITPEESNDPYAMSNVSEVSHTVGQGLDNTTASNMTGTMEKPTHKANLTDMGRPSEETDLARSVFRETNEVSKSSIVSNAQDQKTGIVRLQFANKSAFATTIERLRASQNLLALETYTAADKIGSILYTPEPSDPTTEAVQPLDLTDDQAFVEQVKTHLKAQGKWKTANVARRSARRIRQLLEIAAPPNSSEALFLSGDEAERYLARGNFFEGPIITQDQQPLPLQTTEQFLNEYYDDTAQVWIQDPAVLLSRNIPHAREITIAQLKKRFKENLSKSKIPWNCLEMAAHVEDGLRPAFLNNEDCRLLTKLKLPNSAESASRRGYEPGWKEVEKWALLAQGGALTEPHQDSHGYGTYITLNQGAIGFGWLSKPTAAERRAWLAKPATFLGGRWRYIILRPGQTVYFPSGTVHFVFRLAAIGDTLAFGGHVLRCSQIVRWIETMLEEQARWDITNEFLSVSAPAYLDRVEKFVRQALGSGDVGRWGGREAIERFLELKGEFDLEAEKD